MSIHTCLSSESTAGGVGFVPVGELPNNAGAEDEEPNTEETGGNSCPPLDSGAVPSSAVFSPSEVAAGDAPKPPVPDAAKPPNPFDPPVDAAAAKPPKPEDGPPAAAKGFLPAADPNTGLGFFWEINQHDKDSTPLAGFNC
eukprot:scaffold269106_cov45-Prasinocladus_malaysianus.AAC.1